MSLENSIRRIERARRNFFNYVDAYNEQHPSPLDIKNNLKKKNKK